MKIESMSLDGVALDWLVGVVIGQPMTFARPLPHTEGWISVQGERHRQEWCPSSDWRQAGPIIEGQWNAICRRALIEMLNGNDGRDGERLKHWLRCLVRQTVAEEVEVPDLLVEEGTTGLLSTDRGGGP